MSLTKPAIATLFTVLVTSWSASASGASTPLEGTQDLVAVVKAANAQSQAKALEKVKTYFDYQHLVDVPIEPHRSKLSEAQLQQYTKVFRELLEMAPFIASLGNNKSLTYKIGKPHKVNDHVSVELSAYDSKTDMESEIAFEWREHDGGWMVVDVTLDGASLVKGYQNQFGRILRKEGADGLIARLEKRLSEVKSQSGT